MRVIGLLLVVSLTAVVVAVRLLPWWGALALFAGLAGLFPVLLRWGLPRLLMIPFRAKGAVLRDAAVDVHVIERVEPPAPDSPDLAEHGPREYYRLEVTITPRPSSGRFGLWEPGELAVVGPDARAGAPRPGEAAFDVSALEVQEDGRFEADRGMKYGGVQRLRLLLAVPPGRRRLRFRYYFEVFGDLSLPAPSAAALRRPLATTR